ncbi:sigma 54-interacting transcriptional regulator [Siphonobacter sp.]|uniref:sigma 54-interacting transcriptional regulator n=1 Tax=Siphonobacter sp. TaxID=1869184 RepID=UPI003B3BD6CE
MPSVSATFSTFSSETDLLAQLRQKEVQQTALLAVSTHIAAARDRHDLQSIVSESLLPLIGGNYYTLGLINEDGCTHSPFLHTQEQTIKSRTPVSPIQHEALPIQDGFFNVALESEQPVVFSLGTVVRRTNRPSYIIPWYNVGIREMVLIRLCTGQRLLGVLYIYAPQTGAFLPENFPVLKALAAQLSMGVFSILAQENLERQRTEIEQYKQQLDEKPTYRTIGCETGTPSTAMVGGSEAMQGVFQAIAQVAPSDATVLLLGETGTGKEVMARAIHEASSRHSKLMIKLNCAAIPASLIESELFGHEKGSFTGANERRVGKFEQAHQSTLFLDEIGDLSLDLQVKLLRVLQEKEIERIGGSGSIPINVRIVAATNRNLEKDVQAGRFRSDLYYRLHVFPIHLPPLRQRQADIPALASLFIERYAQPLGKKITGLAPQALKRLQAYHWPGNVRELEHLIERSVLVTNASVIQEVPIPAIPAPPPEGLTILPLDEMERRYILAVVRHCKGRISGANGAAVQLGLPPTTLISKMQKLGIRKAHVAQQ